MTTKEQERLQAIEKAARAAFADHDMARAIAGEHGCSFKLDGWIPWDRLRDALAVPKEPG